MKLHFAIRPEIGQILAVVLFLVCGLFSKSTTPTLGLVAGLVVLSGRAKLSAKGLLPLILWLALMPLSSLWSIVPASSLLRAGQFIGVVALWGLVRRMPDGLSAQDKDKLLDMLFWGWVMAMAALSPPAILQAVMSDDRRWPGFLVSHFLSKNGAVILTVTAFPLMLWLSGQARGRLKAAALLLVLLAAVLAAHSSSALVGLTAGGAVWLLCRRWPRLTGWTLSLVLPALVLLMPWLVAHHDAEAIARAIPHFSITFFHRLMIWDFVSQRIFEHPWLGWGFDAARAIPGGGDHFKASFAVPWSSAPFHEEGQYLPLHPHNAALQVWLELGALGAVATAGLLWLMVKRTVLNQADGTQGAMAGLITAAACVSFVAFGAAQAWWLSLLVLGWLGIRLCATETAPASEHPARTP